MAYKTYHAFLAEQERTYEFVKLGMDGKGFDNHVFLQALNSSLAKTCSHTFITPYIALGSVSRVLAYGRIILPQVQILDKEKGTIVFDCHQFGDIHGKNLDGSVATSDNDFLGQPVSKYFIFFSYHMEPDGFYDCFAKIVASSELGALMSGAEDIDDDGRLHEVSKPKLEKYVDKASKSYGDNYGNDKTRKKRHFGLETAASKVAPPESKAKHKARVMATEGDFPQYHEDLPSYSRRLAIEEPTVVTEVSKALLGRYIKKANKSHSDLHQRISKLPNRPEHDAQAERLTNKATKRSDSIDLADRKIGPKTKVHATEEPTQGLDNSSGTQSSSKQVNELAQETLKSYTKKARVSMRNSGQGMNSTVNGDYDKFSKHSNTHFKRGMGLKMAKKALKGE